MKKNILPILIGLLLVCTVLAIFYFNTGKSTPKPKPSTATNPLSIVAKITNISGNTIQVEQMATNAVSTPSATVKAATYKIEVAADTTISFTKNPNFFLPETKTPEKLTFADLKIGYLAVINTASDTANPQKITATSIDIFDVSNTLAGNVVSISDNTMKFNVISLNIKTTDKNSNAPYKIKTYTVAITSNTELTSFNNGKEIPIKLSDIKAGNNAAILADQRTDVSKTDSINAVKIVVITTPPPLITPIIK